MNALPPATTKSRIKFYFDYSTVHGVRYIGGTIASKFSRVVWAICFLASLAGMSYYLTLIYHKGFIKPEIGLRINVKPVNEYPFPALTICPPIGVKSEFLNYKKAMKNFTNLTPEKLKMFTAMAEVCDPPNTKEILEKYKNFPQINSAVIFNQFSPLVDDALVHCAPRPSSNIQKCVDQFIRVVSGESICYTFNLLPYNDIFNDGIHSDFDSYKQLDKFKRSGEWDLHDGYVVRRDDVYPMAAGQENYKLVLKMSEDEEKNFCSRFGRDYKLFLHMPNEIVTPLNDFYFINLKTENKIHIHIKVQTAELELAGYSPDQRGCYFNNERNLSLFKQYTKYQCFYECLINFTIKSCGCAKYSMPRFKNTKICGLNDAMCYNLANKKWPSHDENFNKSGAPCDCLPSCTEIIYNIEQHNIEGIFMPFLEEVVDGSHFNNNILTDVNIFFDDFHVEENENFLAYKLQQLISDIGGILGLFMGSSLLSLVELFYHLILITTNLYRDRKMNNLRHIMIVKPMHKSPSNSFQARFAKTKPIAKLKRRSNAPFPFIN